MPSFTIPLLLFLLACIGTFLSTPFLFNRLRRRGIVGRDMNKSNEPEIPEMGGIGIWLGFALGVLLAIFLDTYLQLTHLDLTLFLAGMLTITIVAFIGIVDDLIGWRKGLRQYQHALLPILAALPLMAVNVTNAPFSLPLIGLLPANIGLPILGGISFSLLYSLILVPIGVTGASNATNMLAGLNGLETGLGALIIGTLFIISVLENQIEAAILAASMTGALLGFLVFNWFPAKVFGGDSLTLMVGATIATISILGNMEKIGIILMVLYFIELVLKAKHKFQGESFGKIQSDGTLKAPEKIGSLTHIAMRSGKLREDKVVLRILVIQLFICIMVLLLYFLNRTEVLTL